MPTAFSERSERIQRASDSLLCVGLDPDVRRMPKSLRARRPERALPEFLRGVVDATRPYASAYKFQLGAYWAYGPAGFAALERAVAEIGPRRLRILDLKANDVPNTMRLARDGIFRRFGFDAITVSPWMGWESFEALADDPTHGFYVVAHSSNPGSRDLQEANGKRRPPWLEVLARVRAIARRSHNAGAVVGATYPDVVRRARHRLGPGVPILLPGVGAQGGELAASVRAGIDDHGGALVVSASRSILYASAGSDWARASGVEARRLCDAINVARRSAPSRSRRSAR
ncbi:MAG: orotidine-5'-phosphate decarboxylase [Thermoplasmata archaeon]